MEALQVKKDRSLVQQWLAAEGRYVRGASRGRRQQGYPARA